MQGRHNAPRLMPGITELAARQDAPSAEVVKPLGWTWQPTGEKFADWWAQQETTARNVWLRSMNVRLEFDHDQLRLDLGDLYQLTEEMNAGGPVVEWQEILTAMAENKVQGLTIGSDAPDFAHFSAVAG